jgi:hypothetical protein
VVTKKLNGLNPELDQKANEVKRRLALLKLCGQLREKLQNQDPRDLARQAAMSVIADTDGSLTLVGEQLLETYSIKVPTYTVFDSSGQPARLQSEMLWLHYLDRADGSPLTGRWVNLSEIGGLFYQQAFQGYCGDELAAAWGSDIDGLRQNCLASGGWPLSGLTDLAFEWRILPRLPLCLCYRLPTDDKPAWATVLFDAAASHYVAADVAAIVGKELADRLKPI